MKLVSQALLLATVVPAGLFALDSSSESWKRYYRRSENKVSRMHLNSFLDSSPDICNHNPTENLYSQFNAIIFGDFVTAGHDSVSGPLAVKGMFYAFDFTVNKEHSSDCTNLSDDLNGYGLVVGGSVVGSGITVNGAVYLPPGSDVTVIKKAAGSNCPTYSNQNTGVFDFAQIQNYAIDASIKFSSETPSLYLDASGKLSRIGQPTDSGYDIITFNTCRNQSCPPFPGKMSDPNQILFGKNGGWNGPQPTGESWPTKLIINVPVDTGKKIQLLGSKQSLGMMPCGTIFNFYPSSEDGVYADGRFDLFRDTTDQLAGTILLPKGDINDGYTGGFAGRIIAAKYTSFGAGTQMFDFAALGGVCSSSSSNCFPLHNDPNTDTAIAESSTVSEPDTTLLPTVSVEETFLFSTATDTTEPPPPANTAVLEGTCSPQIDQDSHIHKHHHHLKPACCNIGGYHHHHELLFCEYDDHQHEEINDGDYEFDHGIQF
ncbi:hypothetical protein V8B55DRAFT_1572278 [Mucor lusitanicus]|uniref:Choice-of-anchor A domain-containing protein n=2 Tax=Mucor circinelloides f. lusitanicus TaxID=29924 RepID=A0A168H9U8_MUCCL|nr:hypothetical protein FB192DRAFT_1447078 [Mucor lusitanicus]OAC98538.1 hypothetical protein MUCCIDRAFT_86286 [Mucor lusitanicus CBS 277.49]